MDETHEMQRLVRRKDRRLVAGVAGGIGDHFGVSPNWFRLGFVLTTFVGGMGVAAYLLLWFLIPREDLPRSAAQRLADRFPDAPAWIGVGLIAIGVLSLTSRIGDALGLHLGSLAWALLLIGGGLALYRRGEDLDRTATATGGGTGATMPPPPGSGAMAMSASIATPGGVGTAVTEPLPAMPIARPPRRPRERSPLGWLALGVALAASGVVAVLRDADLLHITMAQALAIPLTIIGAGLVVGAFIGRARWTVLLGLLMVPTVMAASAFTVPLTGTYDDITVSQPAQVRSSYEMSGGRLTFDLGRMDPAALPPTVDVRMGTGTVEVILPPHGVRVEATVNIGDVHMGRDHGGFDVAGTSGDPNATTVIAVHVDVGEVQVWTAPRHHVPAHTPAHTKDKAATAGGAP